MKTVVKSSIGALVIGLQTAALSRNNYEDLVAEGSRWVNVDGPYASKFEDDAQRLSKHPTRNVQLELLRAEGRLPPNHEKQISLFGVPNQNSFS